MPITENFDKAVLVYLIHGCKHEKCKHIEDEEENLIENVTTSQNV